MGILDDAIREHLELKRRRGADASEVERQEREILTSDPAAAAAAAEGDPAAAVEAVDEVFEAYEEPVLSGAPILEEEPVVAEAHGDLFPGTGELLAAASGPAPIEHAAPAEPVAAAPEAPVREPLM